MVCLQNLDIICVTPDAIQTLLVDDGGVSQRILGHRCIPNWLHGLKG